MFFNGLFNEQGCQWCSENTLNTQAHRYTSPFDQKNKLIKTLFQVLYIKRVTHGLIIIISLHSVFYSKCSATASKKLEGD